jgi:ABC-type transporter Mla subunit MlaD
MKYLLALLLVYPFGIARAQTRNGGVPAEWDVRQLLDSLTAQTEHLRSFLDQVSTDGMVANGAPQTYLQQWKTAHSELQYLLQSMRALNKQPERLPLALDAYFRMGEMESTLASVFEGIRKYQNPALAELLQGVVNENSTNRDRLRQYVQELAVQKEEEFQVADKEAQRCRGMIMSDQGTRGKRK